MNASVEAPTVANEAATPASDEAVVATGRSRRVRVGRPLRVVGIVVVLAALLAPLALNAIGARLLVVDGGSMAPTFAVGDVLVVTAPTGSDLRVGRPVVIGEGASRYVHRVIEVDGDRARLRGDANTATDPGWVTQTEVTGVVAVSVGGVAALAIVAATSTPGRVALALGLVFLFLVPFFPRRGEGPRRVRSSFGAGKTSPGGRP